MLRLLPVAFLVASCAEELTGVEPLPPGNGYRDWTHHPDNPFTRDIGGHRPGSRYLYYNDPRLFAPAETGGFPDVGAVVVKEVYDEDVALRYLAVMRRLPDHPDSEEDGWVFSMSYDNGKTEQLYDGCITCHTDPLSLGSLWAPPPPP